MKVSQLELGGKNNIMQLFGIVQSIIKLIDEALSDKAVINTKK